MTKPRAIDGSDGPLVVRRIVVWRRLEPGDARTPGTELAPESPHLEAQIIEVGIGADLFADLERLHAKRDEVMAIASGWTTRYEPAGVLFTLGGAMSVGTWLEYLPSAILPFAGSLALLGIGVGAWTKARKYKTEREAERRWRQQPERKELDVIETRLTRRWERFATQLREERGFRADIRVGDIHEAERLVSIDLGRITHPDSWRPDSHPNHVRYGRRYADGRVVEKEAELEETDVPEDETTESEGGAGGGSEARR